MPVTCVDVENVLDESRTRLKPVMAVAAMGLTPMSPVMSDAGTVETPVLVRMAKSPAVPRGTGSATGATGGGAGVVVVGGAGAGAGVVVVVGAGAGADVVVVVGAGAAGDFGESPPAPAPTTTSTPAPASGWASATFARVASTRAARMHLNGAMCVLGSGGV